MTGRQQVTTFCIEIFVDIVFRHPHIFTKKNL